MARHFLIHRYPKARNDVDHQDGPNYTREGLSAIVRAILAVSDEPAADAVRLVAESMERSRLDRFVDAVRLCGWANSRAPEGGPRWEGQLLAPDSWSESELRDSARGRIDWMQGGINLSLDRGPYGVSYAVSATHWTPSLERALVAMFGDRAPNRESVEIRLAHARREESAYQATKARQERERAARHAEYDRRQAAYKAKMAATL